MRRRPSARVPRPTVNEEVGRRRLYSYRGGCYERSSSRTTVNQRELKKFEELLHLRRHELLAEAERTVGGMSTGREDFPDPTDRASLESSRNAMLRVRDRERKLLTKIDEALGRIANGTYGLCQECGEPIAVDRLKARPVTTLCIECKADQEAQERRRRPR